MSEGIKKPPKTLWICLDVANGNYPGRNYTWWYNSKKEALARMKTHKDNPDYARLWGPFKYEHVEDE